MTDASGTVILFDSQDSVGQIKAKGNNSQLFFWPL